jgi:hypothetical protein
MWSMHALTVTETTCLSEALYVTLMLPTSTIHDGSYFKLLHAYVWIYVC